ncbi:MAG TPA: PhoPQ-activated protein PqaA family protein [Candidatus Binatia bacterium]|jgi:PhoPQ-activated pathogenicity-related protein
MMFVRAQFMIVVGMFACAGLTWWTGLAWADLDEYIRKPEPNFAWKQNGQTRERSGDQIFDLHFVSQTWQGGNWQHQLQVYRPQSVAPAAMMFLWVTGGSATPEQIAFGMELARKSKAPVAVLYDIPNQPLLEGKLVEDDLIAETFVRYLKSKDENWPLLFPMVKSVVKAMDVLQAFGKGEWGEPVSKFIVGGASKRGWTTWLGAAVDQRIGAIAPVVIDTLNMRAQMPRQLKAFGGYSARLQPYTSRGLVPIPDSPEGERLLSMVDPWAYRARLQLPKLIVNGTNDFYWATDALNLYWNELPANKWVIYVPNAGHDLRRRDQGNSDQRADLINGLAAFSRHQINRRPMPEVSWKHEDSAGKLRLSIAANPQPLGARLWVAQTDSKDFRTASWTEQKATVSEGIVVGEVTPPEKGHVAFFGELDYEIDGLKYQLSTQIRVTE